VELSQLTELALSVHELLLRRYGPPALKPVKPPLDELIQTILSQNTSDTNSERAYESLRAAYPTWEAVRSAPTEDVAEAIRVGGLGRVKAPRIQSIIAQLEAERGSATLDALRDMPVEEARRYLLSLPGVGPKTAACVLLFSLGMPALPVDTHVHRVSQRVGLIGSSASAEQAHTQLEALVPQGLYYPFHLLMIQHGRTLCKATNPRCSECPLEGLCPFSARQAEG